MLEDKITVVFDEGSILHFQEALIMLVCVGACNGLFQTDPENGAVYLVKSFNYRSVFNAISSQTSIKNNLNFLKQF